MPEPTFADIEATEIIQPVLRAYETLSSLETARTAARELTVELYDAPITAAQSILDEESNSHEVIGILQGAVKIVGSDESYVDYLQSRSDIDNSTLEAAKDQLAERKQSSLFGAASLLLGIVAARESRKNPEDAQKAKEFLRQDADIVADLLMGKTLRIGTVEGTITETRSQDGTFNERYLQSRPIFGKDRKDIYVGNVRGKFMLFIAAGDELTADSCVTIMAMDFNDDTILADKPTRVADAFGITNEQVGTAHMTENGNLLFDLQPRKQ